MGLTTRPPGALTGIGPAEPAAPPSRELRALVIEIRALASAAASAGSLPPSPEPRAEAARSGVPSARLASAVEAGAVRALIAQELGVGEGRSGALPLLYRPDVPPRPVDGRAPSRDRSTAPAGEGSAGPRADPRADGPTEGPMRCVRRTIEALLAGDARAFTAQWVYPACVWIDGRWLACPDETALAEFQARLLRVRYERGAAGAPVLLLRVDPVGEAIALVHALPSEERIDGGAAREVEALYTTVRTAGGWRVATAFAR